MFRLKHGNARYGAYLLALIAMIVCPVVTFTTIDIPISPKTELATGAESAEVVETFSYPALPAGDILPEAETSSPAIPTLADSIPLGERISGWLNVSMPWVLVIWMVGVVVLSVRLLMGFVGVYRWRHHLQQLPERLAQRVASLSERLRMRGFSRVFISPTVLQAMAVGYLRPMVLLPAAMVTRMQPEMLEAVIAHELAHIRRFDLWVNLAQRVTETLLFYHPAVWWLSSCLRSERELCCDELAVKATGQRLAYATTLESVGRARFMAKPPILAAGLGQDNKPTLGRVRHILGLTPTQRNCPFWLAGVITVLFLAALVIPTTLALTNQSDEKLNDFERVVVEGIRANRDKFECGVLAWSNTRINEAVVDRVDKELTGQYELWWDGKKMATKYVHDQVHVGPEGNRWVEKQQGGDSYDGGVLSRKPNFRSDNWLGPHITRWRGVGSQDWLIRQDSKQENISRSWSVVDSDGAKLIRVISRNMNETSRDYRAYGIRDYDPSKGYGLVYEEWFNPDDSTRMKNTVKLMEVIPGGWFPVEVNFKSASMEDGVRVDHNNNYKLDIARCSFNDKSALPDRIFKSAIDKQLKYQEKLQKYLAMELKGLSVVKEIEKADKVKLGARETLEKFVVAAMTGDLEKAGEYAHSNKLPANQIADLTEIAKGQNLWIMAVVADDFSAIAVSSVIHGDHERIGPLVFFLDRVVLDGRDNWLVHDIDMETPDGAEVELKQFLEKHPKAQKVPYENKPDVPVEGEREVWATVEGQVLAPDGKPIANQEVYLQVFVGGDVDDDSNYRRYSSFTDTNGQYLFNNVEPGSAHIGRMFHLDDGSAGLPHGLNHSFEIKSDKNFYITLGGKGRPVIGKLVPASGNKDDINWSKAKVDLDLKAASFSMGFWEYNAKIVKAMIKAEGGNFYRKNPVKVNPDGTFRLENVRAGQYMFRVYLPEHKIKGFHLFRNFRVNLMRNGTANKPLNLGNLIVSHNNYIAPRHIDNLFLDRLELDKDIPVILKAGNYEEPDVVSTKSIRFEKDGESVTAVLNIEWKTIVADRWQATLKFQSENGSTLARSEKYVGLHSESLHFVLGPLSDLSKVKHFLLTIQPAREQLTAAVQVEVKRSLDEGHVIWGEIVDGLQVGISLKRKVYYQNVNDPEPVHWQIKNTSQEDKAILWQETNYVYSPVFFEIGEADEKKHLTDGRLFNPGYPEKPEKILLRPGEVKKATFDLRFFRLWYGADHPITYEITGLYSPRDRRQLRLLLEDKNQEYKDVVMSRISSGPVQIITISDVLTNPDVQVEGEGTKTEI
ncbi:MAG: M56 family metallopeptidase [Planctomycetota bacterium]